MPALFTVAPVEITIITNHSRLWLLWVKQHSVGVTDAELAEVVDLIYEEAAIQAAETDYHDPSLQEYFEDLAWDRFYNACPV